MNKNRFKILLTMLVAVLCFSACSKEEGIDPSSKEPSISYPYEKLVADLNKVDNLPVVAVVKSAAGLKSVSLSIRMADNKTVSVVTVDQFFNPKSYSLSQKINYKAGYTAAVVEAIDLLDRRIEQTLPIQIIDVVDAPQIVFTPDAINYDETVGGDMPKTHFVVSTTATLSLIEMYRVDTKGQTLFSRVEFTDEDPQSSFTFDELIQYGEFDKGFKVKAVDNYGQVRITTLPVTYKTVPPPVVTFASQLIMADKDEKKAVNINITSAAGAVKVVMYRIEGTEETEVKTTTYPTPQKTLAYAEQMTFTNATTGVKVVVTDNVKRSTTASTKACVNMYYAPAVQMGTAPVTDGETNRLLSLGDQQTYSVEACFGDTSLQSHADVKVYYMNGNAASVRIYSMENSDGKNGEYSWNGKNIGAFGTLNATRMSLLDASFDFDTATAEDIAKISAASIQSSSIKGKDELIGKTIAFKTAATSSAGAGKVGIMKLVSISDKIGANANARVFTFTIKLPKE